MRNNDGFGMIFYCFGTFLNDFGTFCNDFKPGANETGIFSICKGIFSCCEGKKNFEKCEKKQQTRQKVFKFLKWLVMNWHIER
jgi:hypothetical protein